MIANPYKLWAQVVHNKYVLPCWVIWEFFTASDHGRRRSFSKSETWDEEKLSNLLQIWEALHRDG